MINITEVRIHLREDAKLKAFASMTLDNCFVIQGMKLIHGSRGLFVAMPNRRRPDGTFQDICHPLDQKTRTHIEGRIVKEYERALRSYGPGRSDSRGSDRDEPSPVGSRIGGPMSGHAGNYVDEHIENTPRHH